VNGGLSAAYLKLATAFYVTSALKSSYAGKKMDKSPWKDRHDLKWEAGNYHPLAMSSIAHTPSQARNDSVWV
jgi:hypothetical protein